MTSNGLNLAFNGSDSSKTFDLSSVRNRKLFERITYNFPPDLYFFCWRGYLGDKEQDTDINIYLYFEEFKRKHVVFQALFNLSRIKLGNRSIDLFDPPTPGKKGRTHKILYQEFPLTPQGKAIWRMAEEDGMWEKLLLTPKAFLLNTGAFTEYFNRHYFFDKEAQIIEYQTQLKTFKRRAGFTLPNEGEIVFDDSEPYHFVSFNYVDSNKNFGRLLKGEVSFLRASLYCGECHQLKLLFFSLDDLKVHYHRGDEHHYLCYHESRPSFMFFIRPDFTRLRHVNKRSGKTVDLSNSLENPTNYKPKRFHVPKQTSKIKYVPPKIHREVEIVSLGNVYRAEVLRFAYKKDILFSREQLINHLISKRELTQDLRSLSKSDRNYNFQKYDEAVSEVINWLRKKGWLDIYLEAQNGAKKGCNRKSVQISPSGKQFWSYLLEEYGSRGLLSAQLDLSSAHRMLVAPQTILGLGVGICGVVVFFAAFIALLLLLDFISSFL